LGNCSDRSHIYLLVAKSGARGKIEIHSLIIILCKMKAWAAIAYILFLGGCTGPDKDQQIKSLTEQNAEFKEENDSLRSNVYLLRTSIDSINYVKRNTPSKFEFVILYVTQDALVIADHVEDAQFFKYCTEIKKFPEINEDLEYQLMDGAQSYYQEYYMGAGSGRRHITDRKCLVFDSYAEASKERQRLLTNQ
jgi:hypothetical protein